MADLKGSSDVSRRLDSWKEIAAYLGRDVRTAQRWERREGLPVHRLQHSRLSSVFAYTAELDSWRASREPRAVPAERRAGRMASDLLPAGSVSAAVAAALLMLVLVLQRPWVATNPAAGVQPDIGLHTIQTAGISQDVYEAYLKGRFHVNGRDAAGRAGIETGISYLQNAIADDPGFAPAHTALAAAYRSLAGTGVGALPVAAARPRVMAAVREALQLDPELAEAHTILAGAHAQAWQWEDAEAAYRRALARDPDSPEAHVGLGGLLLWRGRTDEGLDYARRGREVDPASVAHTVRLGWLLYHARRYDEAIREFQTVLSAHPDHRAALWFLGFALIEVPRIDEAIATLERLATLWNRNPAVLGVLARAYGRAGRRATALDLLHELKEREAAGYVPPAVFVHAYIGLGDSERAFASLERAYVEQSNIMMFLRTHPLYDPIRTDPRFRGLLERVGLADR